MLIVLILVLGLKAEAVSDHALQRAFLVTCGLQAAAVMKQRIIHNCASSLFNLAASSFLCPHMLGE